MTSTEWCLLAFIEIRDKKKLKADEALVLLA